MADLALVTAGRVELIPPSRDQQTKIASVDIVAGQAVYENTDGQWALADASAAGTSSDHQIYVALKSVQTGQAVTAVRDAELDGYDLSALAPDAKIYLSDTAGALSTTVGTVTMLLGRVTGTSKGGALDKVLKVLTPA